MMISKNIGTEAKIKDFPKLMANMNVVALFTNEHNAVVVFQFTNGCIDVGDSLDPDTCDLDRFRDYTGIIQLQNG
jgi:hypothetical protein